MQHTKVMTYYQRKNNTKSLFQELLETRWKKSPPIRDVNEDQKEHQAMSKAKRDTVYDVFSRFERSFEVLVAISDKESERYSWCFQFKQT